MHGNPSAQLEMPRQRVGVHQPNSGGHGKASECITPTRGTTPTGGIPSAQLEGPCQSVGVHHPKAWRSIHPKSMCYGHTWDAISATREATPKRASPSPQLESPHQRMGPATCLGANIYKKNLGWDQICHETMSTYFPKKKIPLMGLSIDLRDLTMIFGCCVGTVKWRSDNNCNPLCYYSVSTTMFTLQQTGGHDTSNHLPCRCFSMP